MVPSDEPVRALVTGATAGIGRALSTALAARGDRLVLVARDAERLDRLAGDLARDHGVEVRVLPADLSHPDGTAAVAGALRHRDAPVDLLVNNAGFGQRLSFADNDLADELRSLDVHVRAPMQLCHAVLPGMRARGRGAILNVSSTAGWLPRGTYGAHKAWLTSFTRWLDLTYRRDGVRAMALCPGFVRTEFHQRMGADTSGLPGWLWLDADAVAAQALRDLDRGVRVSVPSTRYAVLSRLARVTPDRVLARVGSRGR